MLKHTSYLLLIIMHLLIGCNGEPEVINTSSSAPDSLQLSESNFIKFIDTLKTLNGESQVKYLQKFLLANPQSPITENNGLAAIYYYGSEDTVYLTADWIYAWASADTMHSIKTDGMYFHYKLYSLPDDARVDYLFSVKDSNFTDPRNPFSSPSGYGNHSALIMPGHKKDSSGVPFKGVETGSVDSIFFKSRIAEFPGRMIAVYKPAGYEQMDKLPVIYINDGFKAMEYESYTTILDNLIHLKTIRPVIAVFIDYREVDGNFFLNKNDNYIKAICDELVPFIDKNYKTSVNAKERVIAGISAGGHFSLMSAFSRGDIFLNAAGQSTTLTPELIENVKDAADNPYLSKYKFYLDVGRYDLLSGTVNNQTFLYANQELSREMSKAGLNHSFKVYNDGHQWGGWREHVDDLLIWFFGN